ncbi:NCS1 family nucleobase:cation symporter-1 [Zavarzinia sp.]|uniref:NCS1 family nucleobase:cation symporter-1 n=1 Tax=Zavarzinia sp. TaxID=2027920 RepID=UPI003BB7CC28|nr:NCS1 family nucleobase:cation symporter-1 [Zavarzinia sp.]
MAKSGEYGQSSRLWNEDLAPTDERVRTWRWYHFAALWIGMVISVPVYMLASGLIEQGMTPLQAVFTIFAGNLVILVPMVLIGHAGARHGIPYAVLARASFGTRGAQLPALARAIVACGWYGIQTWIGGSALLTLLGVMAGQSLVGPQVPGLGIGIGQLLAFLAFWGIQFLFINKNLDNIRKLETWTAPLKIVVCALMVWWALDATDGLGDIFKGKAETASAPSFAAIFWPSFTAMAGFWSTLCLNIPDFTRFAKTQRDQVLGQAVGLPGPMALLGLVAVITTSATVIVYGEAIWDPVQLSGKIGGIVVLIGLLIISLDTVSCNLAANLVGPAYDFSALWPSRISYRIGGYITAAIAIVSMPWELLAGTNGYIFVWLVGYGALLGPIVGIMIADYWIIRRSRLDVADLYREDGAYSYRKGWNPVALVAFAISVLPNIPGFLHAAFPNAFGDVGAFWTGIYGYAWFVGAGLAVVSYTALTLAGARRPAAAAVNG